MKTLYENLGMKYSGHTAEFNKKIMELNSHINELTHNEKMLIKENESMKELYEQKLINKELENTNLRQQIRILELERELSK